MSDAERFVADLRSNPDLQAAIAAGGGGLEATVKVAQSKGYNVTLDEARTYLREKASNLSNEQLDAIAGGKGGHSPAPAAANVTQVVNVQTAVNVTTAEVAAEVGGVVVAVGAVVFT